MDSKKVKISRIFVILMMPLYLRSITATNFDCNGKPFHCVNSTHFMICVDLGDGVSKTVDDFVIQCPPTTVCRENNYFECEYRLPTTTQSNRHPGEDANDFTIDTTLLNDVIHTISPIQRTDATRMLNEYNVDTTTHANVTPNVQIHKKNEEITDVVNKDNISLSNDHSKLMTEIYNNLVSNTSEINSRISNVTLKLLTPLKDMDLPYGSILSLFTNSDQAVTEKPFVENSTSKFKDTTDILNITTSNGDFIFIKTMDPSNSTAEEIVRKDVLIDHDFLNRNITVPATQTEETYIAKYFSQNVATTATVSLELDNAPSIEVIKTEAQLNQVSQRNQEVLLNNLLRPEVNIPEYMLITEAESYHVTDMPKVEKEVYLPTLFNLTEQRVQTNTINITYPNDLNILETSENYNHRALSSILEPIKTSTEYDAKITQTIQSTTVPINNSNNNELLTIYNENQSVTSTQSEFTSTMFDPLEYQTLVILPSKSYREELNMTSVNDNKLIFEDSTTAPESYIIKKYVQVLPRGTTIQSPLANDISTISSVDDLSEVTSTITINETDSNPTAPNIKHRTTTPKLSLFINTANTSHSYAQNVSEDLSNFSTTSIPDLSTYITNRDLTSASLVTTLDSIVTSVVNATDRQESINSTTLYLVDGIGTKIGEYINTTKMALEVPVTSTRLTTIPLSYDVSDTEKISGMETDMSYGFDNVNVTSKFMKMFPELKVAGPRPNNVVTESSLISPYTHINQNLQPQDENSQIMQPVVTENPYIYGTSLIDDIAASAAESNNLKEIIIHDKAMSTPVQTQYKSVVSLPSRIHNYNPSTLNLLLNADLPVSNHDFTTSSTPFSSENIVVEVMTGNSDTIEGTTVPFSLQNEIVRTTTDTLVNSTLLENHVSDLGQDSSVNTRNIVSAVNTTESAWIEPKLTVTASKNKSDFKMLQNEFLQEIVPTSNSFNIKSTSSLQNINIRSQDKFIANPSLTAPINNILQLKQATVNSVSEHVDLIEMTTELSKTPSNTFYENTVLATAQQGKQTVLLLGVDKAIEKSEDEIYNTANQLDYKEESTRVPKNYIVPVNKLLVQVTTHHQQAINDTMNFPAQDEIIQTTEKPSWNKYYLPNTEVVARDIVTTATSLESKVAEILSTHNQITTEALTNESFDIVNTENKNYEVIDSKHNVFVDQSLPIYTNNANLTINGVATRKITVNNTGRNNTTMTKTIEPSNKLYLSLNESSTTPPNREFNDDPSNVQSTIILVNNTSKQNNAINNTIASVLMPNSTLWHTVKNNNTEYFNLKNNQLNKVNEDYGSNKRSLTIYETLSHDTLSRNGKVNSVYNDSVKINKTLIAEVALEFTSNKTNDINSNSQFVTKDTEDLYLKKREYNSTNTTVNDVSNTPKKLVSYPESATTVLYQPVVPLMAQNLKQPSLYENLSQRIEKDDSLSTHRRNYKFETVDHIKKSENVSIVSRTIPTVYKNMLATPYFVKTESKNITNLSINLNKTSGTTTLFKCINRVHGRFADENNCRKYYICIGINKPILGECPPNTVFSEIRKQCTKNLSHCVRNNQFRCNQEGRFIDVFRNNIYYICVKSKNNIYVRFQFQCQNGYHLNKTSVTCVNDIILQSETVSTSMDNDSNKGSRSTDERKSKEKKAKKHSKHICKEEGKFYDAEDCRRYYVCSKTSKSVFRRRTKKCDSDEVFHREKKKCVDSESYECN